MNPFFHPFFQSFEDSKDEPYSHLYYHYLCDMAALNQKYMQKMQHMMWTYHHKQKKHRTAYRRGWTQKKYHHPYTSPRHHDNEKC